MISLNFKKAETKDWASMKLPFLLFMFIIFTEYLGLGGRFPIINALHLSWVISLIILLFVMTKHDFVELVKSSQFRILLIFLVWTFIAMFFALIRLRYI